MKHTLRMMVLGAALAGMSFTGLVRAADDAKPATPAPATQPNRGGRFGNPQDIIKNFRDQFEGLNLTDDQMKKIDGFLDTATTEVNKAGDDRRAAFQAIRTLNEDTQSILTDTQKTALRAKRISQGFDRLKSTYTADSLKLTDDQKTKIGQIIDDAKKEALAAPAPDANANGGNRGNRGQAFRELRDKLNAVLTPDQQKEIPQFGGPNGGRRGNRGGNNGNAGAGAGAGGAAPAAK